MKGRRVPVKRRDSKGEASRKGVLWGSGEIGRNRQQRTWHRHTQRERLSAWQSLKFLISMHQEADTLKE